MIHGVTPQEVPYLNRDSNGEGDSRWYLSRTMQEMIDWLHLKLDEKK